MSRAEPPTRPLLAGVIAALVLLLLGSPHGTAAHADLVDSDPAPGASLVESPDEVRLTFSEAIDPEIAFIDLLAATQERVRGTGPVEVSEDGTVAVLALPELDSGAYTVTYQVISSVDGHAATGTFAFVVDPTGSEAPPPESERSAAPAVEPAGVAARWLALAGAIVALGSLILWWRSRAVLAAGAAGAPPWLLAVIAAAASAVGLVGYLALAAAPILEAAPERRGLFPLDPAGPFGWTPFATAMRLALAALVVATALALIGWLRQSVRALLATGTAVALAGALAAMSTAAHAAALGGPAFAIVDWAHLLGVAAWLGGLPAVLPLARRSARVDGSAGDVARSILRRHGTTALVAAPVVALTGVANSPLVLGETRNLVGDAYGNLVLAKAALLSVAVAIGAVNHLTLRGSGRVDRAVLVAAELLVAVLAINVAATMVTIQPAAVSQTRVEAPTVAPAHLFGEAGPTRVHATIDPPAPGTQRHLVTVTDARTGAPRDDLQRVFLELTPPPGADLPETRVDLEPDDSRPGLYAATGTHLAVEGEWTVSVVVRRAGARDEAATFSVAVAPPPAPTAVPPPDTGLGVPAPLGVAWSFLPRGPAGWVPAVAALVGLVALGWRPRGRSAVWQATRAALAVLVLVAASAAGSRDLVYAANAPSADELARHERPAGAALSADRGRGIYLANCAACHGPGGDGDGPITTTPRAGGLEDPVRRMSSAELSYRIAYGLAGTPMPAFAGSLTVAERWDLITYLEERFE